MAIFKLNNFFFPYLRPGKMQYYANTPIKLVSGENTIICMHSCRWKTIFPLISAKPCVQISKVFSGSDKY